jgi:hypothetical protein
MRLRIKENEIADATVGEGRQHIQKAPALKKHKKYVLWY